MTWGASTIAAAPAAASVPPAFTMKRRRSMAMVSFLEGTARDPATWRSPRHKLVVGALGDVVPRADQRLELRERRVHLSSHWRLFRFLAEGLGRELFELPQDRNGKLDHLDLVLELYPELLEGNRILGVETREAIDLDRGGGMVEHLPQVGRKGIVRLLVEAEVIR